MGHAEAGYQRHMSRVNQSRQDNPSREARAMVALAGHGRQPALLSRQKATYSMVN